MKWIKEFRSFKLNESRDYDDYIIAYSDAFEKASNWRKPEKVTEEVYEDKLRHYGKVPFTKKEMDYFQKLVEKNTSVDSKIYLGIPGESTTVTLYKIEIGLCFIKEITKLDDEWYLINGGYFDTDEKDISIAISNINDNWVSQYYICDEWEEVLGYLDRLRNMFNIRDEGEEDRIGEYWNEEDWSGEDWYLK